jgi:TatD family-associated radical SAM protein
VSERGALAYRFQDGIYLNLTNRCPTRCRFCAKRGWKFRYRGIDLALGPREPSAAQAWTALLDEAERGKFREIVFCGYGEPTYRLGALRAICRRAREAFPHARLRLNTIGLGSLIHGRDISADLACAVHGVRVSLNTADEIQWRAIHDPFPRYASRGFQAAVTFVADCIGRGLEVTVTAVEFPGVDIKKLRHLTRGLGAGFLPRPQLL